MMPLRRGLRDISAPSGPRPFPTRVFNAGKPLIDDLDNVAEVLAFIEGREAKPRP